jgi:hypothetical protein
VSPPDHQVRLHFKVLKPLPGQLAPRFTPDEMLEAMRKVYKPNGIDVALAQPVQTLDRPLHSILHVGGCALHHATAEQEELFAHRDNVPVDEICVYFLYGLVLSCFAGCASCASANGFPYGRPAAVVTADATVWTLGHECGHVLGLSHVGQPTNRVMLGTTSRITAPAVLDQTEVTRIKGSHFAKPVVAPLADGGQDPSGPAMESAAVALDMDAAEALPSKVGRDDGLADHIRTELDRDDGVDYERLARELGPSAVHSLRTVLRESRPRIAAGAASLSGMIEGGRGLPVVDEAAGNDDSLVRSAAAATAIGLPVDPATRIVERLLKDDNIAVRGHALRSAARIGTPRLRARIGVIAARDPSPDIRELAARLLRESPESAG